MNKAFFMGRLTADPDIRYTNDKKPIARYSIAVDRISREKGADYIRCVAFDKSAEFSEKYLKKGTKILVSAHVQTSSYKDRNGNTVYTTDFIVDSQEFCESKGNSPAKEEKPAPAPYEGFMTIPDDVSDEGLPFS